VGLRPLACWNGGFGSGQVYGCLSLVSVVCCQVEVSASGWSLFQKSRTKCAVTVCDREASIMRRPWTTGDRRNLKADMIRSGIFTVPEMESIGC
jgi:hypothetical protein